VAGFRLQPGRDWKSRSSWKECRNHIGCAPRNQRYRSSPWPSGRGLFRGSVPANSLARSVSGLLRLPRAIIGLTGIHEIVINKGVMFFLTFFKRGGT
jgi:hypothetical protein